MQETGVWISFPISDVLSIIFSAIFIARLMKRFSRIKDGDPMA
jgi:Na+-driven multidrug efflux pump